MKEVYHTTMGSVKSIERPHGAAPVAPGRTQNGGIGMGVATPTHETGEGL